jgi:hypothetical protein
MIVRFTEALANYSQTAIIQGVPKSQPLLQNTWVRDDGLYVAWPYLVADPD